MSKTMSIRMDRDNYEFLHEGCGACRASSGADDHDPDRIWSREQARKG